jgi:hypothetical protein
MSEVARYIQRLLEGKGLSVGNKYSKLYEEFITESGNIDAVRQILGNQTIIMNNWELKTKIQDIKEYSFKIPNGTVGKRYSASLDFSSPELSKISYTEFVGIESIGLAYDNESESINGIPEISGDYKIELKFRVNGEPENSALHSKLISIIINPDPKSLWKNISSDSNDVYWKKDSVCDFQSFGFKNIVVSSKRGRSHANVGSFRDDDYAFKFYENTGWSVVSVSDGAGSAKFSRKGSEISCQSVLKYFEELLTEEEAVKIDQLFNENFLKEEESLQNENIENSEPINGDVRYETPEEESDITNSNDVNTKTTKEYSTGELSKYIYGMMGNASRYVHNQLHEFAQGNDMTLKDLHSTLIFVLFKKYEFGYVFLSFGVGDCPIGIINKDETEFKLMNWLDVGEHGGGTRFITMPEIFSSEKFYTRINLKVMDEFSFLFLMTDGIYDPKFIVEANLEKLECWKSFIRDLEGNNDDKLMVEFDKNNIGIAEQLSVWMDFWSSGNHDDRTLMIIF